MEKTHHTPPKLFLRFFRWFCHPKLLKYIEGDLIELYDERVKEFGKRKADRRFVIDVLLLFRPGIIKPTEESQNINQYGMLKHFLKIFFRSTIKNGSYSFINISGLAVGLACSICIVLWANDEITFDDFHKDKERIFQVMGNHHYAEGTQTYDDTPGPLALALKELPEVEESCRITFFGGRVLFNYNDQTIYEEGAYADSSVFNVFTIPLVQGNSLNPLPDNNSIAISKKLALKYFNTENPIGKVFRLDNKLDARVTAVFIDLPENSTLHFDFIAPYSTYSKEDPYNEEWGAWTAGRSFVKLKEGSDIEAVSKKINETFTKPKIWPRWDSNVELFLFPITDWRLYNNFSNGKQDGGRIIYVRAFSSVAIFILLIACINFMNLATARSMSRAREVGVRKVIGAARQSLIRQFLGESILISFISLLFGLGIVYSLLPWFNTLTGKNLTLDYSNPIISVSLIFITVLTGIIAGSYPAFFLSSLKVIHVLKGRLSGLSGEGIRKGLVVFQFSLSVILIIGAVVTYQQIEYMRNKNLGFDKENVFYFKSNAGINKNFNAFKNNVLQNPKIKSIAKGDSNPMEIFSGMVLADNAWPGKTKEDNVVFKYLQCDQDFLFTLGFTITAGRMFSSEFISDSTNYIITEEAARRMKLSDPVGQILIAPRKGQIVGVVKDFHTTGLKNAMEPVIIAMRPLASSQIFVRYEPGHLQEALAQVETIYKKTEPDFPIEYKFMDETFGRQYQNELMFGKISACFTIMAIFISTLGLFGLASFTAEKRAKEIGVRKVLGATVAQVVTLLCRDFIILIGISLGIGLPVAGWVVTQYLSSYQFHTAINLDIFVITSISLLLIALLTVSFQSARAAMSNPIKSLRS